MTVKRQKSVTFCQGPRFCGVAATRKWAKLASLMYMIPQGIVLIYPVFLFNKIIRSMSPKGSVSLIFVMTKIFTFLVL